VRQGVILPDAMTDTPPQWEQRLDLLKVALQMLRKFVNRWLHPGASLGVCACSSWSRFCFILFAEAFPGFVHFATANLIPACLSLLFKPTFNPSVLQVFKPCNKKKPQIKTNTFAGASGLGGDGRGACGSRVWVGTSVG
jgi:hypothetical protein